MRAQWLALWLVPGRPVIGLRVDATVNGSAGPVSIRGGRATQSSRLTPSQLGVLRLRAEGMTNDEVSHRLGIGLSTVKNHTSEAYKRLGTTDIVSAMNVLGWVRVR